MFPFLYNYTQENKIDSTDRYKLLTQKYWSALEMEEFVTSSKLNYQQKTSLKKFTKWGIETRNNWSPYLLKVMLVSNELKKNLIKHYFFYLQEYYFKQKIAEKVEKYAWNLRVQLKITPLTKDSTIIIKKYSIQKYLCISKQIHQDSREKLLSNQNLKNLVEKAKKTQQSA